MAIKAKEVFERVRTIAQDQTSIRWPLAELREWLNEALGVLVIHKPSATAASVIISLAAGTYQQLPAQYVQILAVTRNLKSTATSPRQGDRAVTPVDRSELDLLVPDWHDTTRHLPARLVRHVLIDPATPREFYVYPANDGTGVIEVSVARMPSLVPLPDAANVENIDAYDDVLDVQDVYASILVDYVLYRAYSKDAQIAALAQRAAAHYSQFAQALGIKLTAEQRFNAQRRGGEATS